MALGKKELDKRFGPHAPDAETAALHDEVNKQVRLLAGKLDKILPANRHTSLVMTALEDVRMRANAALAEGESEVQGVVKAVEKAGKTAVEKVEKVAKDVVAQVETNSGTKGLTPSGKPDLRTKEGRALRDQIEADAAKVPAEGNVTPIRRAPRRPA